MISRILFIAIKDYISVISLSDKGKSTQIPFDGQYIFKIQEDFWSNWCAQTSYLAPKSADDSNATICDFCFVMDKDYPFSKDDFLKKVIVAKNSIWKVEKIRDVLETADLVKQYREVIIKMSNDVSFSVIGTANNSDITINAKTNISDMDYKLLLEEKNKQEEKKKLTRKRDNSRRNSEGKLGIGKTDICRENNEENVSTPKETIINNLKPKKKPSKKNGVEDSPIVKYNKKLRAEEKSNG